MQEDVGLLRKIVRSYTFHSPLARGKHRLSDIAIRYSPAIGPDQPVKTADGRKLLIDPRNASYKYIYFLGYYEPVITRILSDLIHPGDICLDIGANMGWYTTLFQKLAGDSGRVHSFEPVPPTFELLKRNVRLNEPPNNVRVNNMALGDEEREVELHVFADLPDGHASIATFGRTNFEAYMSEMSTLDRYLSDNHVGEVNLVKIDIEGSELMMLRGASRLFEQESLPIFEIEMSRATSVELDYLPNDLIDHIKRKADYRFFAIDERAGRMSEIDHFLPDEIGANVLCYPADRGTSPIAKWLR